MKYEIVVAKTVLETVEVRADTTQDAVALALAMVEEANPECTDFMVMGVMRVEEKEESR